MRAENDSMEQHGSGRSVWTLGVGAADGPKAFTWRVSPLRIGDGS